MDNPFADLQREREKREQREEQARQERERKYEAERIAAEQRKTISFEFDQMVRIPLEQLRDAIYPRHQIVGCYEEAPKHLLKHEASWSIGRKSTCFTGGARSILGAGFGDDDGSREKDCWEEEVRVDLEFVTHNRPSHFKCIRNASYKRQKPVQLPPPPKKTLFGRSDKQPVSPQPVEFENVRYAPLVVELSQEALVKALGQLHPAGSF